MSQSSPSRCRTTTLTLPSSGSVSGIVLAGLGAAALLPLQGRSGDALGHREKGIEVERQMPAGVVLPVPLDPHPPGPLPQHGQLVERLGELVLGADDADHRLHAFLEILLDGVGVLGAGRLEGLKRRPDQLLDLARVHSRGRRGPARVLGCAPPGPLAEHQQVGQRVAAQTVGPVHATRDLARGEQARHGGGLGLGVHPHATHHVVAGGAHLHRLLGDVDVGQLEELVVHPRQPARDVLRVAPGGDVEVHPAVGAASTLLDLGVDGPRHLVARQEIGRAPGAPVGVPPVGLLLGLGGLGPEHLGDVAEHEPLTERVAEHPAVAPDPFGDEDAAHRRGPHHARRVELDELHVDEVGARPQGQGVAVTGVLPGVRCHLVGLADPTRGQNDRRGTEHDEAARLPPVAEGARDAVPVREEPRDRALHEHLDPRLDRPVLERADHLEPGAIAYVGQPGIAVTAEVALEDAAVRGAVEQGAPLLELEHPLRGLLGVDLCHAPVAEHLAAPHGVPEVDPPVVLRVDVGQRRGDPALGHHGVRLAEQRLAHHRRPRALGGGLDGGPEPGPAGPHDNHIEGVGLVVGHQKNLGSSMAPVATRRTYRSVRATPARLTQAIGMWRALRDETNRQSR